ACSPGPSTNGFTVDELRGFAKANIDRYHDWTFTIDGVGVPDLASYRFPTPVYTFVAPPNNNFLETFEVEPCFSDQTATPTPWTVTNAVADGYCVMVAPLAPGQHTIHFSGEYGYTPANLVEGTFNLTVVDTNRGNPGVFPPDSAPYGKTYPEWAAE